MSTVEQVEHQDGPRYTRRQFLVYEGVMGGTRAATMERALDSDAWAVEHPDEDLDEAMTWAEWQAAQQ